MFSPYYAWARRRQGDDGAPPEAHNAINLSLYRRAPGQTRFSRLWAMTERGQAPLHRAAHHLQIGPSRLAWRSDGRLQVDVQEWAAPWPQPLRGRLLLRPQALPGQAFALDAAGHHHWQPISPRAELSVDFSHPRLQWQGEAYLDCNHGRRPLARDFHSWQWSRSTARDGACQVQYEVQPRQGPARAWALALPPDGQVWQPEALAPVQRLPNTAWGLARQQRAATPPRLLATLESGPFYSRSLLQDPADGRLAVHESLSLQRFEQPWVQALLPFRMPRRAGGRA